MKNSAITLAYYFVFLQKKLYRYKHADFFFSQDMQGVVSCAVTFKLSHVSDHFELNGLSRRGLKYLKIK